MFDFDRNYKCLYSWMEGVHSQGKTPWIYEKLVRWAGPTSSPSPYLHALFFSHASMSGIKKKYPLFLVNILECEYEFYIQTNLNLTLNIYT